MAALGLKMKIKDHFMSKWWLFSIAKLQQTAVLEFLTIKRTNNE